MFKLIFFYRLHVQEFFELMLTYIDKSLVARVGVTDDFDDDDDARRHLKK